MTSFSTLHATQKKIALLALAGFAFLYFICSAGINGSNDGSHFALAKAVYQNHTTEVKPFFKYIKCCDFAEKDGKIYSDRLPGTALLMLPFLAYAQLMELIGLHNLGNFYESDVVAISLLPNICAVLSLLLLFLLYRQSGFSIELSFISTVIYGLATLHWLEATHAFSHMPSTMLILLAVYYAADVKDILKNQKTILLITAIISFSSLIELQNILFLAPFYIYLFYNTASQDYKSWIPVLAKSAVVAAFFVGCLLLYNYITFGELILKSNTYNPNFPEEKTLATSLGGNFILGLDKLLTSFSNIEVYYKWYKGRNNDTPGIFVSSPVMIVSLAGYFLFIKKERSKALLFISLIVISIIIAAFHKTTLTRHIFTITPFFFFPFIYVLQSVWQSKTYRLIGLSVISSIVLISMMRIFYINVTYWEHGVKGFPRYLTELPFFFAFYIPLISFVVLLRKSNHSNWFSNIYNILLIVKVVHPAASEHSEKEKP
jgi:hypothetical protein